MKRLFAILLCAAGLAAAQTATPPPESAEKPKWIQKVIDLKYADPVPLSKLLGNMQQGGSPDRVIAQPDLHAISIGTYDPSFLKLAEEIIKRYDVPQAATSVNGHQYGVEIVAHILLAGPKGSSGDALPADLAPVAKQLRSVFGYTDIRLLDSALIRGREGRSSDVTGTLSGMLEGQKTPNLYTVRINKISVEPGAKGNSVALEGFRFSARFPYETRPEPVPVHGVRLQHGSERAGRSEGRGRKVAHRTGQRCVDPGAVCARRGVGFPASRVVGQTSVCGPSSAGLSGESCGAECPAQNEFRPTTQAFPVPGRIARQSSEYGCLGLRSPHRRIHLSDAHSSGRRVCPTSRGHAARGEYVLQAVAGCRRGFPGDLLYDGRRAGEAGQMDEHSHAGRIHGVGGNKDAARSTRQQLSGDGKNRADRKLARSRLPRSFGNEARAFGHRAVRGAPGSSARRHGPREGR